MKTFLFIVCLFFCIRANIFPESVYSLDADKDVIIGALSIGAVIAPYFIDNKPGKDPCTLNENRVNNFDRRSIFSYNKPLDIFSDYCLASCLALLPVISVIPNAKQKGTVLTYSVMYAESLLLMYGTVFSIKNAVIRYRPYIYAGDIPKGKKNDYYNSFPSSSTSFAFLGATFLSATFLKEFPESKWKFPVVFGSYTLAASVGTMRILSGSHFLTDVLAGAAIGSLYGWLIPMLHLRKDNQTVSIIPTGNGILISLKY